MGRGKDRPESESDDSAVPASHRQRLDKWLWFARVARTRSAAAELAASGHVRVNGQRAREAAKAVRPGDVLTIALDRRVLLLRVIDPGLKREEYARARLLYEDLSPDSREGTPNPDGSGLRR